MIIGKMDGGGKGKGKLVWARRRRVEGYASSTFGDVGRLFVHSRS